MKTICLKTCLTAVLLLTVFSVLAQNEQKGFSFQGYARDFSGAAYSSENIIAQFTIYPDGEAMEYQEQQSLTTDDFGVFHAVVGSETPVAFAAIDFSAKKYFMQVEVKVAGGDFVEITNTELLAVPYAKASERAEHAKQADNSTMAGNGVPPGTILPFGGPIGNIPTGYLPCDGSSIAVTDYPALHSAIGDSWGGDGGTNFNTPDLRGQFLRGQNQGTGVDPEAASRTALTDGNSGDNVGSYQNDAVNVPQLYNSHNHFSSWSASGGVNYSAVITDPYNAMINRPSIETRPKNAYVLFMIKY